MEMVSKALRNWKIHALALVILVIAEFIGNIAFSIGPAKVVLIPMLYAFVMGALCGVFKIVNMDDMLQTSSLVGITFFILMARYGTLVGPNFWKVVHSAPALLLQEFGNLGTILLGVSRRWPLSASVMAWTAPKASASWACTSPAPCSARCSAAS